MFFVVVVVVVIVVDVAVAVADLVGGDVVDAVVVYNFVVFVG